MPTTVRQRVYTGPVAVIGDIHGETILLSRLLARLPKDIPVLVVGDVGDRGPDTRGVIDQLVAIDADGVTGNHDLWLTRWANGRGFTPFALAPAMGGEATLRSYGVHGRTQRAIEEESWRVPASHRAWLDTLPILMDLEVAGQRYWIAHAGVPGTVSFAGLAPHEVMPHVAQHSPEHLLWPGHDPHDMVSLDRPVLMGHMTQREPLDTGAVIAVDTGAGRGGSLSAVLLPERRFITVAA